MNLLSVMSVATSSPGEALPDLAGPEDQLRRNRKYKAFWAAFLTSTVALFWNKLTGAQWVEFNTIVFGLYMVGNVGEHWTKRKA